MVERKSRSPHHRYVLAAILAGLLALVGPGWAAAQAGGTDPAAAPPTDTAPTSGPALRGSGMWIWYVRKSHGGNYASMAAQARRYAIRTLYVKSSDGSSFWSQFNPTLISYFHARGIKVCAWQYVYGKHPITEANLGARAVDLGADCLVIDAESEYEGRYASAATYLRRLRAQIGSSYPLALAGFPYVDYHPAFPYSVFLGPGGAQYNLPQMYWHTIGTSVNAVYAHTYTYNMVYRRPIFPVGQTYGHPRLRDIRRFRQLATAFGAKGVSWWDWQESTTSGWNAVGQRLKPLSGYAAAWTTPVLKLRSRGDLVVWAQEYLNGAGYPVTVTGIFGSQMDAAVRRFQYDAQLAVDGRIGPTTWSALFEHSPQPVRWTGRPGFAHRSSTGGGRTLVLAAPRSASLPAVRDEIPPKSHRR